MKGIDSKEKNLARSRYALTIGLEVHAELKTNTKMFCACKNDPDEKKPNVNICPICMGHPGTLPVINSAAIMHVLRVGSAVGGTLADFTEFDRKSYFYPDIPKGYQISQYAHPLVRGGSLKGVELTRIHLEEDTARSSHDKGKWSLVDFNRAGVPLMELVTEPVIKSAREAAEFADELQLLLRTLRAGEANMEKGEMRVEANVSVSKDLTFGTKVEVKNLNSFKSVEKAIAYEYKRQCDLLERGEKVVQETRGFDEIAGTTFSQRLKESSHDYRYFPDPDLPKLTLSELEDFSPQAIRASLPKLPNEIRAGYETLGVKEEDREMLLRDGILATFVNDVIVLLGNIPALKIAINYCTSDLAGLRNKLGNAVLEKISPKALADIATLVASERISSRGAKEILTLLLNGETGTPEEIATHHRLIQESNQEALILIVQEVLETNPHVVEAYRAGKEESLQFLVGQGMKISKGSANPQLLQDLFKQRI